MMLVAFRRLVLQCVKPAIKSGTMAEKGHDCKHSPGFFTITLVVFFPSKLQEQFILKNKLGLIRGNIHTENYVT
jgi:hypothetical protein